LAAIKSTTEHAFGADDASGGMSLYRVAELIVSSIRPT
jgi:hypothetical protein